MTPLPTIPYAPDEPRGIRGLGVRAAEWWGRRGGGVKSSSVTAFYRDLAIMLDAGLGIRQAMDTLLGQAAGSPEFFGVLRRMRQHIVDGGALAEAMAREPLVFDPLEVRAVEVGEQAGVLETSLGKLAQLRENRHRLKRRVIVALTYPAMVILIAVTITLLLMTFVVPTLLEPIVEANRPLPLPTAIVKGTSDLLIGWWWLLLPLIVAAAFGLRQWIKTPTGRLWWDTTWLKVPVFGPLLMKVEIARAATVTSTLLNSGIGMVESVATAADGSGNVVMKARLYDWHDRLANGEDVAPALANTRGFPPLMVEMVAVGAQSGKTEAMLDKLAATYEEQARDTADRMAAIVEPALIVVLAGLVLLIALAVLLPLLEIYSILGA